MKLLIAIAVLCLGLVGCCSPTESKAYGTFAEAHKDVFGCYPKDFTPPERVLDAVGPQDEVAKDFLGYECGKPVYKSPCADCK